MRNTMISVQFKSYGPGACSWCRKHRAEVFAVVFSDQSFSGPMCWNDLRCAIRFKVTGDDETPVGVPPLSTSEEQ
jgi:hypothetical protein